MSGPPLLERDAELAVVREAVARAAQGTGGMVLVDGPAGVGKTALMQAARDAATESGLTILRARGAELERDFAFGVVRQLFDEALQSEGREPDALFTGAARFAAPLLGIPLEGVAVTAPEDPFAARHALYWLAANLAGESPVAMLVDDAHWADDASLNALAHLANRLEGVPIALIVATRIEEEIAPIEILRRQAAEAGSRVRLGPLGQEAAAEIVRAFAPLADDATCVACFRASGGNAFLLQELARSIRSGSLNGGRVAHQSPERVTREVADRLARLPGAAARLARAAAILGENAPLRQAAALAGVDPNEAPEAADALITAGLLATAQPVEFLHPLLRDAVYEGLGPAARSVEHSRAARLLAEEGASLDQVAAQLLRCPPADDPWTCEQLLAAAHMAAARGGAGASAAYLRRALDEPPPREFRAQIVLQLGVMEAMASDPDSAIAHLREALAVEIEPEHRVKATVLLSGLLGHQYRFPEAVDAVERQLDALAGHPELQATAEAALANVSRIDPAIRRRAAPAIARLRKRVEGGEERDPAVLGTIATEMVMAGEPADVAAGIAERALDGFDWASAGPEWSGYIAARVLTLTDRFDGARAALDQALDVARERGSAVDVGGGLAFRAELNLKVGDLTSAEVDARTLFEVASESGWAGGVGFAVASLGEMLVQRGELGEAEELLFGDESPEREAALTHGYTTAEVLRARGGLRVAQGRVEEGANGLREAGRWSTAADVVNPSVAPWRSPLIHALLDLGQDEEARRLAADELARARAFGSPRALGVALVASGRVEGGQAEIKMLREAVDVLDGSPALLEMARAQTALGAALRRSGGPLEAREPLRVAIDLAHRCGAHVLEDQALDELRATGARPRRRLTAGANALTPSERRIAELAAGGQHNREIAQALFVTTATVEFHLRNAYRKLEIGSRTELAGALEPQADQAAGAAR